MVSSRTVTRQKLNLKGLVRTALPSYFLHPLTHPGRFNQTRCLTIALQLITHLILLFEYSAACCSTVLPTKAELLATGVRLASPPALLTRTECHHDYHAVNASPMSIRAKTYKMFNLDIHIPDLRPRTGQRVEQLARLALSSRHSSVH